MALIEESQKTRQIGFWRKEKNGTQYHRILAADGRCVAATCGGSHNNQFTVEEIEAHAALIECAPTMLAALKVARYEFEHLKSQSIDLGCFSIIDLLDSVIESAERVSQ